MAYVTSKFDHRIHLLLKQGRVGVLPTDTIYGLSCIALSQPSVQRIHLLKHRDKAKPFVILISKINQLTSLGINNAQTAPALAYWPGPLTLICEAPQAPNWLSLGTATLAIRQPNSRQLRRLMDETGPLISTSVNFQGSKPSANIGEAMSYFGDKLDFYVDAGEMQSMPSTIVKSVSGKLKLIRQGVIRI